MSPSGYTMISGLWDAINQNPITKSQPDHKTIKLTQHRKGHGHILRPLHNKNKFVFPDFLMSDKNIETLTL